MNNNHFYFKRKNNRFIWKNNRIKVVYSNPSIQESQADRLIECQTADCRR